MAVVAVAVAHTCLGFRGIRRWVAPIERPLVVGWVPSYQRNRCEPPESLQAVELEYGGH